MKKKSSAITKPKGFKAAGLCCGIKKAGKKDLALIFSQVPALAFGLFTKNSLKAAPLKVTREHLRNHKAQAIVINSGNANCYTGKRGLTDAREIAVLTAKALNLKSTDVLVASTGIIAKPLPMKKIKKGLSQLCLQVSDRGGLDVAYAIQTTDKVLKQSAKSFKIRGKSVCIGAIAKGAGMIFPDLKQWAGHATMLCFINTDADIQYSALVKSLNIAIGESFNSISVDGCMSTNDMVLILANRKAENKKIKLNTREFYTFRDALIYICKDLAKKIVRDGEGASKFIKITIKGARSAIIAKQTGFAIANSLLFKTACFGENPNIGRIVAAIGAAGVCLDENKAKIKLSSLRRKDITLRVDLKQGKFNSVVYTSDISLDYVKINAGYH